MILSELYGIAAGQDVFVLGNGTSLDSVDLSSVPRDRSIGVNRILKPGGRNKTILGIGWAPKFLVIQDPQVWAGIRGRDEGEKQRVIDSGSIIIALRSFHDQLKDQLPVDRCITFITEKKSVKEVLHGTFCSCYLTGTIAAQLAARMAFPGGRVFLCGMDLQYPKEGKDHSYGSGKRLGCAMDRGEDAAQFLTSLRDHLARYVEFIVVGNSLLKSEKYGFSSLTTYP